MSSLQKLADILNNDGIIVIPTETVYGIACNAFSKQGVEQIYNIKQRDRGKPFSLHCKSVAQAQEFVEFNDEASKLARQYLPGPLCMILSAKPNHGLALPLKTIAIRVPDNNKLNELYKYINYPLFATSANISGQQAAIDDSNIELDLPILKDGKTKYGKESTIIDLTGGELKLVRQGILEII